MTCAKCSYEFCWLCLGDFKKHSKETGSYLCNSYSDVKRIGREKGEDIDRETALQEMKKFEHYSTRYMSHFNAVAHCVKRKKSILHEITQVCNESPKCNFNDFRFLLEMANLCIAARRTISMTYGIRFYLKGESKKRFFDFL